MKISHTTISNQHKKKEKNLNSNIANVLWHSSRIFIHSQIDRQVLDNQQCQNNTGTLSKDYYYLWSKSYTKIQPKTDKTKLYKTKIYILGHDLDSTLHPRSPVYLGSIIKLIELFKNEVRITEHIFWILWRKLWKIRT